MSNHAPDEIRSPRGTPICLVTGASGFVGRALVAALRAEGRWRPRAALRRPGSSTLPASMVAATGDLGPDADWRPALSGVQAVVHCAARVHIMADTSADPLAEFRRVNVDGTLALARQAAAAGVRRFVLLSSVKVHGEATAPGHPFHADDAPRPEDAYGLSKHEAEQALRHLAAETGLEVVVVRSPLVYGPGVKANFAQLMRAVALGVPLPLGALHNRRSLVGLDNLVDLLRVCLDHPAAANQTFLVSDGEDLSTTELVHRLGRALGRPARLLPVPAPLLRAGAALLGRRAAVDRLCGSLQVDIASTRARLGWTPPVSVDEGLRRAAAGLATEAQA